MSVCAIIVTYNPNMMEFSNYYHLNRKEVDYTLIVDNSEDSMIKKEIALLGNSENTELIDLGGNKGIAYAQNIGIKRVKELQKFKYILFLDQDTLLMKGSLSNYMRYYNELSKTYSIAALGVSNGSDEEYSRVNQIISSGTFSPLKVFDDVGYFDESLFIDFVEYDWCWRALEKNYSIFSINIVKIKHMHGSGKIHLFGFSMVIPSNIRLYYQYRNILFLLHRKYVPLKWKIKMVLKMILKIPLYFLLLPHRKKTLKYLLKAFRDYFLNKKGKIV